jgi:hypothetical protein
MSTQAQKEANRQNAQKSTGPKTEAGKAKCCRNRLSHGFAASIIFVPEEDREDFNGLLAEFHAEYLPATHDEEVLMEKMVQHHWNSLRAFRVLSIAMSNTLPLGTLPGEMSLLMRYQAASDRGFYKARTELLTTQKERKKSEIGSEPQEPVEPPQLPASQPQPAAPAAGKMMDFGKFEAELDFLLSGREIAAVEQLAAEVIKRRQAA